MPTNKKPNRLVAEKSPYLLQHANNPVDWYPWGQEAFDKARNENKPLFVSIGYSTCHWCHVMERESFEDNEVAALLNEHFISVKVDREERPDIDSIYMDICIQQNGRGGWPLNVFLTPDQKPFYVGTYFSKETKYGRPGLMEVLPQLNDIYVNEPDRIRNIADELTNSLIPVEKSTRNEIPSTSIHEAFIYLSQNFDDKYGGFGNTPKFPSPSQLLFLLRYHKWTKEEKALKMVEKTLNSIADGGIYDHIGAGFARYSTDEKWLVPHFEKMLHDQALLLTVYTEAYQITQNDRYKKIVYDTVEFIQREMTHPEGGFYSAIDADSEGKEGTYYIWTVDEVYKVLGADLADLYCEAYNISQEGNFEGVNIPHLIATDKAQLAELYELTIEDVVRQLEECRVKLLEERIKRTYPHLDDKILTSWNGLCIAALANAGATFSESSFIQMAEDAASFLEKHLWTKDFLHARFRDGEAKFLGYVDDYAYLLWGYMELHQATNNIQHLQNAITLSDSLFTRFVDEESGGFHFTDHDSEALLIREINVIDGATPSGNGTAALQLWRLAKVTANNELLTKVDQLITSFADEAEKYPIGVLSLLMARMAFEVNGKEIVISGSSVTDKDEIISFNQTRFHPFDVWLKTTEKDEQETIALTEGKRNRDHPLAVYICESSVCHTPLFDKDAIKSQLTE